MEELNESTETQPSRSGRGNRRRRGYGGGGGRRSSAGRNLRQFVNAPWFDRVLQIALVVAAVLYLGLMVDRFHDDETMIGDRMLGSPPSEILYGYGRPQFVGTSADDWQPVTPATPITNYSFWRYPAEGGGTFVIRYGARGADEITCYHRSGDNGSCPGLFWVQMGDLEDRVAYQLGAPPVRILRGPSAILRYPSIGVDFELQEFEVRRFTIRTPKSAVPLRIPRFIRFLIP